MSGVFPSPSQVQRLRVVDLRERLQQLGLSTAGLKADLVSRLNAHYSSEMARLSAEAEANAPDLSSSNEHSNQSEDTNDNEDQVALQQQTLRELERQKQAEREAERQRQEEAEAERRRQEAEAERQRQEVEAERQRQEAEAERQRQEAERQKQLEAEAERQRQEAEAERQRQEAEAERQRQAAEAERQIQAAEAERQKQLEAEAERQRQEAERQKQLEAEAERQRKEAEVERQRQEAEAERQRQEAEAERQRQEAEAERQRQEAEAERKRQEAEAEKQKQLEAEAERQKQLEAEAEKQKQLEAELQRKSEAEEAEKQRQPEIEKQRIEAERQKKIEAEKKRQLQTSELISKSSNDETDSTSVQTSRFNTSIPLSSQSPKVLAESVQSSTASPFGHASDLEMEAASEKTRKENNSNEKESSKGVVENEKRVIDQPEAMELGTEDGANDTKNKLKTVRQVEETKNVPETEADGQKNKNKKKKKKKKNRPLEWARQEEKAAERKRLEEEAKKNEEPEIEYVSEEPPIDPSHPLFRTFFKVFEAFKIKNEDDHEEKGMKDDQPTKPDPELKKVPKLLEDDDLEAQDEEDDKPKFSKRQLKKLNRLSVAELKQLVDRPDVVEMHDVTARDPRLLVLLKATRNTVPVPRHWCFKRKYLQGKRGIEKPPFALPEFIRKTGIMEMRAALQEKEESKSLKSKMREKVRPKLGKIDIDYQKLHDAFFKWQTKPKMSTHGDLYYEGKEFEIRLKEKKPGDLSDDLRTALGMPVGPNAHKVPPPWLIAMQRYGPPPSYPNQKIAGLNSPIPEGCSFGYHAGGWGKPPVDEMGKPLYGDVFGTMSAHEAAMLNAMAAEEVDKTLWGEMEEESESEEEEEDEDEDEEDAEKEEGPPKESEVKDAQDGLETPAHGLATPSGLESTTTALGQETPELLELRKRRIEAEMEQRGPVSSLYTVLPEKKAATTGAGMMASAHTYDLTAGKRNDEVEMALNPEDLMDAEGVQARAEATMREREKQQMEELQGEDLSDMVAEHNVKKRKRMTNTKEEQDKDKAKRYKGFKF